MIFTSRQSSFRSSDIFPSAKPMTSQTEHQVITTHLFPNIT